MVPPSTCTSTTTSTIPAKKKLLLVQAVKLRTKKSPFFTTWTNIGVFDRFCQSNVLTILVKMVTATSKICRLASTESGLRRILKKRMNTSEYLRKAVDTGVYRTHDEIQACIDGEKDTNDLKSLRGRFRQDIVRGTFVHDYPFDYVVLRQFPPIPTPARIPVKLRKKFLRARESTSVQKTQDILIRKYLNRFEQQEGSQSDSALLSSDEYYKRLFGMPKGPKRDLYAALPNQSATVQQAYNAATEHIRLQRTVGNMSESECMDEVDALLK